MDIFLFSVSSFYAYSKQNWNKYKLTLFIHSLIYLLILVEEGVVVMGKKALKV